MSTVLEVARRRLPGIPDDKLEFLLWECTSFPFGRKYKWLRQLVRANIWAKQGISRCYCCGDPYIADGDLIEIYQPCEKCNKEFNQAEPEVENDGMP